MASLIGPFLLLFLPTISALAVTCDTNYSRHSRYRRRHRPQKSTGDNTTTPGDRTRTEDRTETKTTKKATPKGVKRPKKSAPVPTSGRRGAHATTEGDTSTNKQETTDVSANRSEARVGAVAATDKEKPKKSPDGSSSELEEKTCEELAIDAAEMDTQEETAKETAREGERRGSHSPLKEEQPKTGIEPAPAVSGTGPWPVGASTKTGKTLTVDVSQHTSVFDTTGKRDDVPSQFELDSVKRLQKMSKESLHLTQNNTVTQNTISVEMGNGSTYTPHGPSPNKKNKKKRKKRDRKKEEEVRRWNEAIASGFLVRPRKDDETVDEVQADWGPPM